MAAEAAARAIGAGRIVAGMALCGAPAAAAGGWIGRDARRGGTQVVIRALGVRDVALGIGTATARDTAELRRWTLLAAGCDAVDFAATLGAPPSAGRSFVLALAGGSAAAGLVLAGVLGNR